MCVCVCVCVCVCENTWILSEYLAGNCVYVIVRVCVREREYLDFESISVAGGYWLGDGV